MEQPKNTIYCIGHLCGYAVVLSYGSWFPPVNIGTGITKEIAWKQAIIRLKELVGEAENIVEQLHD